MTLARRPVWFWICAAAALSVGVGSRKSCVERAGAVTRPVPHFASSLDVAAFQKGNLHTHTQRSDGDSSPEAVIAWYRSHGYQFLAITDHNLRSEPEEYRALQDEHFALISGEELTMSGANRQVHVNALCTRHAIGGGAFPLPADALRWAVHAIGEQGGVALINHPNFDHALGSADLLGGRGAALLEIQSGHPSVYSDGVDDRPSHEALWDAALGQRLPFMGVAVDDLHRLVTVGPPAAYPGVGWVEVFADRTDASAICAALGRGLLYASTGVALARIRVSVSSYTVWPTEAASVSFLGASGSELARVDVERGAPAAYALRGGEPYVRARIRTESGSAWTPAVAVTR